MPKQTTSTRHAEVKLFCCIHWFVHLVVFLQRKYQSLAPKRHYMLARDEKRRERGKRKRKEKERKKRKGKKKGEKKKRREKTRKETRLRREALSDFPEGQRTTDIIAFRIN